MGKVVKKNQPCLNPECGSHDARQIYEDGTSFCFSCQKFFPKGAEETQEEEGSGFEKEETKVVRKPPPGLPSSLRKSVPKSLSIEEILELPSRGFRERKITKEVAEFFGVKVSYDSAGNIDTHYYPYSYSKAWKIRALPKTFSWIGKSIALFGRDKFNGAGKRLIIVEGEIDAMSIAQASLEKYGKIYPVVALSSSVMAHKSILEDRDWVRSFAEVVLCLDNDEAGEKATQEAIKVIGVDKVKIAKLPLKDPNEVLLADGGNRLLQCIFDAAPYIPAGIVGKEALWTALETYNAATGHPYPACMAGVNAKLKAKRGGEITLFISGTGSGKSTLLREIALDILQTTEDKIGIVSLEESPAETARKFAGMAINRNPAKEEIPLEELKVGFDQVFGDDRVIVLDHQGSMNDTSIVDQLEYMCLVGCKFLFVDHITIMTSEGVDNLTGNEAQDKVMNDLLRLVKRYPEVWVGLVSHLRKAPGNGKSFEEGKLPSIDDIKGSGSIKQISFDIISFARDLTASDEKVRNTIKMRVLKSRYTGLTGAVPGAQYSWDTGRLTAMENIQLDDEDFTAI
jgi:twinkle protein